MRNVAVAEGDKVEAAIKLRTTRRQTDFEAHASHVSCSYGADSTDKSLRNDSAAPRNFSVRIKPTTV